MRSNYAQALYDALIFNGFDKKTANVVLAQAAHETGNFTSMLFHSFNNPFGMKQPVIRKTTSKGAVYGYATYESLNHAAVDFVLWWKALKMPKAFLTVDSYIDALMSRKYFEASKQEYLNGVKYFYNLYLYNGVK